MTHNILLNALNIKHMNYKRCHRVNVTRLYLKDSPTHCVHECDRLENSRTTDNVIEMAIMMFNHNIN